jgi:hypothetical protein
MTSPSLRRTSTGIRRYFAEALGAGLGVLHECFEEMRREINCARKNCRWRGSRTPQGEEPMARFPLATGFGGVGTPSAVPRTRIDEEGDATTFYAGEAGIELHRTETANYRQNLCSGMPALCRSATDSCELCESCDILTVMADPSEGEALTDAGNDLVATVPMPAAIIETIDSFFAEHIVERPFTKRQRDRCESQIAGHRG